MVIRDQEMQPEDTVDRQYRWKNLTYPVGTAIGIRTGETGESAI